METKTYGVGFYVGKVGADGRAGKVSQAFRDLAVRGKCPIRGSTDLYEIRDLRDFNNGASFSGVFARLRTRDIPHIGEPGGPEREIELREQEGLLEKNHFLYYRQYEILVYQANRNGSSVNQLAHYLSDCLNETTVFDPVLQPDALARLMRGDSQVKAIELSFARPTEASWFPKDNWSTQLLSLLRDADGARMHIEISAKGYGRTPSKAHLPARLKRAVKELVGHIDAKVARVHVEEDGAEHPIDLIADRVKTKVTVEMNGRYPIPEKMYNALREAKDEHARVLREIFGDGGKALG